MTQATMRDRLKDPQVVRVYRNMLINGDEKTARDLRANLIEYCEGHPKQVELEQLFQERFGEKQ